MRRRGPAERGELPRSPPSRLGSCTAAGCGFVELPVPSRLCRSLPTPEQRVPGCCRRGHGRSGSAAHWAPPAPQLIIRPRGRSDRSRLPRPAPSPVPALLSSAALPPHTPHMREPGEPSASPPEPTGSPYGNPLPSPAERRSLPRPEACPPSFLPFNSFFCSAVWGCRVYKMATE